MAVVKAFGSEGYESERVRERSEQRMASGSRSRGCRRASTGWSARCARSAPRSCSWSARSASPHGAISPGELLVFVSYTRKAQSPMRSFAREATKVAAAMARAERIAELLAADDVLPERAGRLPRRPRARATSRSRHVSFGYGDGAAGAARRLAARRGRASGSR